MQTLKNIVIKLAQKCCFMCITFIPEQKVGQTINGNKKAEQSGEILREVIRTNSLASQTKQPAGSTLSPVTVGTTLLTAEGRDMTRHWQKVYVIYFSLQRKTSIIPV
jgi:hypothetical protein